MVSGRTSFWFNRTWALLALVGLCVRAMIPMGYMPTVDRSGVVEITMCSGVGQHEVRTIHLPSDKPEQPSKEGPSCPFAMAVAPVLPELAALDAAVSIYAHEYEFAAHLSAAAPASWAKHAPPTGPPVLI